jgi:hypothetical protein
MVCVTISFHEEPALLTTKILNFSLKPFFHISFILESCLPRRKLSLLRGIIILESI